MTIHDKYYDKIEELIAKSLSISPNNKTNVLKFDNLKKHSNYIQYYAAKNMDFVDMDEIESRKSNLLIDKDNID